MGDKRYIIGLPEKLGKKSSKDFILDDLFFEFIGDVLIKSCLLNVTVFCERKQTYWHLEIKVDGFILTLCDRCGDDLNIKIKEMTPSFEGTGAKYKIAGRQYHFYFFQGYRF